MTPARLRYLRRMSGLSQAQLAKQLGYSRKQYSFYENGRQPLRPGFYVRALEKILNHTKEVTKVLRVELESQHCQEGMG